MKILVSVVFVVASAFAMANETTAPAAPAAPAATGTAVAAEKKAAKITKKEAKAACKAEGKKGRELKSCMKDKMAM